MSTNREYDYLFKIVLIGDRRVGKSNLIETFHDPSSFSESPMNNIDFRIKLINLQQKYIKLQIWDPVKSLHSRVYYRGAHGIIIVYDCTDRTSFEDVKQWIGEVERYACENVNLMMVGNKCDLYDQRVIEQEEIDEMISLIQQRFDKIVTHIQVSVKDLINVEQCFIQFSTEIMDRLELEKKDQEISQPKTINIKKTKKKKNCIIQ